MSNSDITKFERRAHEVAEQAQKHLRKHGRSRDWVDEFAMQVHVSGLKMALFSHLDPRNRVNAMVRATETLTSPDDEEQILVTKGRNRQVVVHLALNQDAAPAGRVLMAYWIREVPDAKVSSHLIDPLWAFLEARAAVRHVQPGLPLEEVVLPS